MTNSFRTGMQRSVPANAMKVQRNDHLASELLSEMMRDIAGDREGMHPSVTDLIGCLTKAWYDNEAGGRAKIEPTDRTKLYFIIGLGLERALLVDRKVTPTYGETDGIHWHVDSLNSGGARDGLLELKSTRANPNKGEEGLSDRYIKQVKSYLAANKLREVDLAIIYLIQPEFIVWHITFDQFELDMHWEWMKYRRDEYNRAKAANEPPKAFQWNEEWECKDCAYKILCELNQSLGK